MHSIEAFRFRYMYSDRIKKGAFFCTVVVTEGVQYHKGNGLERCLTRFNAARCGVNCCLLWGNCVQQPRLPPNPRALADAAPIGRCDRPRRCASRPAPRVGPAPWSRRTSCPAQLRLRRVASRCRRPAADDLGCQLARCASHEARPAAPLSQAVDTLLFNHDG